RTRCVGMLPAETPLGQEGPPGVRPVSNGTDQGQDTPKGQARGPRRPRRLLSGLRRPPHALARRCLPREPAADRRRGVPARAARPLGTLDAWPQRLTAGPPPRQAPLPLPPHDPQPPHERAHALAALRRNVSIALAAFLVMFVGAGILSWLDPFGLERNSQAYSERLNARLEAPFYDSTAQGDIVVVLVTRDTLEQRGFAWPPRYEYYAEVVNRILSHAPRALYVDVLARHER